MVNLVGNAIKFTEQGEILVSVELESKTPESVCLHFAVSDTGVGLAPEQAQEIFNAFFTTKPQGTGMGLPISRSIIESHGGRLWAATSNSGPGATFQFTLPSEVADHKVA